MALLKSINTSFGINAEYWIIVSFNEDFENKIIDIVVNGYVSRIFRDSNNEPIAWQNLQFSGDQYIADVTRSKIYNQLKLTTFINSLDC